MYLVAKYGRDVSPSNNHSLQTMVYRLLLKRDTKRSLPYIDTFPVFTTLKGFEGL